MTINAVLEILKRDHERKLEEYRSNARHMETEMGNATVNSEKYKAGEPCFGLERHLLVEEVIKLRVLAAEIEVLTRAISMIEST